MNILSLFVVVPVLTIFGILFTKGLKGARTVSVIGMGIQFILAISLILMYLAERKAGNTAEMLFTADYTWFASLNIRYAIGVDGIAVAMIGLTAIVVFAGILENK
jgi:NADH-quinone oxidoreductase subunit M